MASRDAGTPGRLSLPTRRSPAPFAFAPDRLGRIGTDGLLVWGLGAGARDAQLTPLFGGRGLGVLADGTFIAVAQSGACRLRPRAEQATPLGGSFLVDSRRNARVRGCDQPRRFLVASGGRILFYELSTDGKQAILVDMLHVDRDADDEVLVRPDGSILHPAPFGLCRIDGSRSSTLIAPDNGKPIRQVAPASHGCVWARYNGTRLALLDLAAEELVARAWTFDDTILAMDGHGDCAAVVLAREADGGHELRLRVVDAGGCDLLETTIPWRLEPRQAASTHVVVSPWAPLVAVADGHRLALWDVRTGEQLQQRKL